MKKVRLVISMLAWICFASCATLHSGTGIAPHDEFVLGKNQHGPFTVKVKNISMDTIEVYKAPVNGGKHSMQKIAPGEWRNIKAEANTGLVFANRSSNTVEVKLRVRGDLGLNMEYSK